MSNLKSGERNSETLHILDDDTLTLTLVYHIHFNTNIDFRKKNMCKSVCDILGLVSGLDNQ